MSELARYEESAGPVSVTNAVADLAAWANSARAAHDVAVQLCQTSFVPQSFRDKPHEATAAILSGLEVGLSPMAALRSFDVINGTAAPRAATLRAIVQAAGHEVWVHEAGMSRAIVRGRRRGQSQVEESAWTMDRAKQLGLAGKSNWRQQPQAMLVARATSELCRLIASDAILGIAYAVEELADQEMEDVLDRPSAQVPKKRTARRAGAAVSPRVESVESVETRPAVPEPDLGDGFHNSTPSTPTPQPDAGAEAPGPSLADDSSPESTAPASITPKQIRNLGRLCTANGLTSRLDALAYVARVIGHDVETRNELTIDEASKVIDALEDDLRAGKDDSGPGDEVTEERYG